MTKSCECFIISLKASYWDICTILAEIFYHVEKLNHVQCKGTIIIVILATICTEKYPI